jgi:tetratricopeptide (TPR) repeat protein
VIAASLSAMLAATAAFAHADMNFVAQEVDKMVAANPGDPELLLRQAQVRKHAGNWDGALVSLALALAHGADRDAVASARAAVFLAAGFPQMAAFEYGTVLAHRPDAYDVLFERGRAELALGHVEAADQDFARAIGSMRTPQPEHVALRADTLRARGRAADAVRALDEGMARLGPVPSLVLSAIALELELQRYDSALARLDMLLTTAPTNAAWIARRADILKQAQRPAEARAEFARALHQIEAQSAHRHSPASKALADRLRGELAAEHGGPS